MKWRITTGPEARADYTSIVDYYKSIAPEQVPRFRAQVRATLDAISGNPYLSRDRGEGIRKRAITIFPYHVWYTTDEARHKITVIAIIHFRRDPALIQTRAA